MCHKHHDWAIKTGDPRIPPYKNPPCLEDGCKFRGSRHGYCRAHAKLHHPRDYTHSEKLYGKKENPYRAVYYPDHPNARSSDGYVAEHTKVMTEHLGRGLYLGENVHHKNGVRHDNRLDNLELWVSSQPSGQRPADLVAWAKEILEKYGDLDD
jgi:hypothetical protein